ncbi:Hypothetical predicted protein [Mytilus galloprovincialis]|uniref:Apple domain-containing protein n=1 Tax=Mytilus galloprovincialis TaxID=29158 RepID=A0A8B6CHI4_MYTGA|nr:Hypothetical predicted protein [Mytilus galloprovincialis]
MTWKNAYEFCVSRGQRLVYSTHSMNYDIEKEYLPLVLADLNPVTLVLFWSDLSNNQNGLVVSDEPARTFGVGRLSYYEIGSELIIIPIIAMSDNFELNESYTDEKIPFIENNNSMIVNKVWLKNISANSTVECEEQCISLISYGIHCAGFNYNWKLEECSLLGNLEDCIILSCRDFIFSKTEGMSAFIVRPYSITIGEYKPINEHGVSTENEIQDNDNTYPMVTDQQASTLEKKATTTNPNRPDEGNAAGQVLTITMGLMSAVACSILIYKAATILNHIKNMKSTFADQNVDMIYGFMQTSPFQLFGLMEMKGKITKKEVEEQLNGAFTIEMSDEDGERIVTEGVITMNVPPNCYFDIIK